MAIPLEQFVKHLTECGVLSADTLKDFLPPAFLPKDTEELARELVRRKKLTKFQAHVVYQGKGASLVLGNYVILDKLGQGGIGQVYKAEHRRMKRLVAIKVLQSQFVKNTQAIERFKREVEAIGRLNHPQIVAAFDADQHHGTHFLVMQYVEGRDLASVVKEDGPLPYDVALNLILQTAIGLQYAHERGVIHRDIKPANLLLANDGSLKILDMGLARFEDEVAGLHEGLTGTGSVMGTVDYMSPEQCVNTRNADARSDIYSLGCALYNLLTGQMVFAGNTVVEKIFAHRDAPIPSILTHRPELAPEVDAIFKRMLAKQPAERYQTAKEVIAALQPLTIPSDSLTTTGVAVTGIISASRNDAESGWKIPVVTDSIPTIGSGSAETNTSPGATQSGVNKKSTPQAAAATTPQAVRRPLGQWQIVGLCSAVLLLLAAVVWMWPREKPLDPVKVAAGKSSPKKDQDEEELRGEGAPPEMASEGKPVVADPAEAIPMPDPSPTVPAPATPDPAPATTPDPNPDKPVPEPDKKGGQTLIVGVGKDELPDLSKAFEQAKPGDTILIRHRGPLEFPPVDLTGKTPLTIAGDTKDGVDYWPIIRQAVVADVNAIPPSAQGLFFGKSLKLTFRKLHLGIAGSRRHPIASVFHLDAGKLELEDCTLTVAAGGQWLDAVGPLIPLVQCTGSGVEPLELTFRRTIVRGGRLAGCLNAVHPGPIHLVAEQFMWAGGPSSWLTLQESVQPCRVQLTNSTLYNLAGLATANFGQQKREVGTPALGLHLDNCVLTGQRGGKTQLLMVTAADVGTLEQAVKGNWIGWSGTDVVWHQIVTNGEREKKGTLNLKDWCALFELAEGSIIEADPMFRVRPGGVESQEVTARDFEPRFARAKKKIRDVERITGASSKELPVALSCIHSRDVAKPELAGVPRGMPRVWQVHQKNGPIKSLEEGIVKVQTDDVIEILDDAVYIPKRNFGASNAAAILTCDTPECLTIRSADDSRPTLVLRDDVQQGFAPKFDSNGNPTLDVSLILFASGGRSLTLDGLHFQTVMARQTPHSMITHRGPCLRISNCTFTDVTDAPAIERFVYQTTHSIAWGGQGDWLSWFENDAFVHPTSAPASLSDPTIRPEVAIHVVHYAPATPLGDARSLVFRGCLLGSGLVGLNSTVNHIELSPMTEVISFEQCTVIGRMANLRGGRTKQKFVCSDNLVLVPDNPVTVPTPDILAMSQVEGGGNAYWHASGNLRAEDRSQGSLRLLPGPLLKSAPVFSGNANANDPLRSFRLKPGQPGTNIATDGGAVGVRFDILPIPPPFRPESSKGK